MRKILFHRIRLKSLILSTVLVVCIISLIRYISDLENINIDDLFSSSFGSNRQVVKSQQEKIIEQLQTSYDEYGSYSDLFTLLAKSQPRCGALKNYKVENPMVKKFMQDDVKFSKSFLSKLLPLTNNQKLQLFEALENYQSGLTDLKMTVFGNEPMKKINGKGIVMVGGGEFSWLALLSIHQLRQVGSKLPVEVFIPTIQDYDFNFCETILRDLNAKCILGYKELPLRYVQPFFDLKNYEYKIMAILASEFEDVLLLDADNVLISNPDPLFKWDYYLKYQMILWPDTWIRTTNPFLFDLFHINLDYSSVNENEEYDIHNLPGSFPNPSTESGMLMVNKRTHVDTLFLALYMNFYGANYYYPLITQGGAGEGDKDTFIMAAYALDKPVYQVRQSVSFIGYFNEYGFQSGGMGQCNPMIENEYYADRNNLRNVKCDEFMFMHLSNPKYFPTEVIEKSYDHKKDHVVSLKTLESDYDFELQIWEIMAQLLCVHYAPNEIQPKNPASSIISQNTIASAKNLQVINKLNIDRLCDSKILPHLEFLRKYFKNKKGNS